MQGSILLGAEPKSAFELAAEMKRISKSGIGDIVTEDAMCHVAKNLSPEGQPKGAMQLVVFNSLPFERDVITLVDLEIPTQHKAKAARLVSASDKEVARQPISFEKSSSFVDSIWDVPRIVDTSRIKFFAKFSRLPSLGYRTYSIVPELQALRSRGSIITIRSAE